MANGNPWFSAVEQTLPQYVPLPFDELMQAGQQVQRRYDTNLANLEETAQGLASIEARLPGHRQYVTDFANRYRTEADELLSKYNYNASDPQFTRELTRLRSRYSNDPNLRTILLANEADKANSQIAREMAAKGQLFINPQARGVDEQGNLINDVGTIRGVNTLSNWEDRLKIAAQQKVEVGNKITNRPNLEQAQQEIMQSIAQGSPEVKDLVAAYESQGMTPEQAQQQAAVDAQRLFGQYAVEEGTNWQMMNYNLSRNRMAMERAKSAAKENRAAALVSLNSTLETKDLNKELISDVDSMMSSLTGKQAPYKALPATPENLAKYPNAERIKGGSAGVGGAGGQDMIRITNEQAVQERSDFIESAKQEISNILQNKYKNINFNNLTDKQVLETYKEYLQADNNAPTFWTSPVAEIRDNFTNMYFGSKGENLGDALVVDKKGKSQRISDKDGTVEGLEGIQFTGITTSPVRQGGQEYLGGAMKGTAVNEDGDVVTIYKPLPPGLQQAIPISNAVDKAATSGLTNDKLRTNPEYRGLVIGGRYLPNIVPQKENGRINFYEVDNSGNIVGDRFDPNQIRSLIQSEKDVISDYFSLHQNTD